VTTNFLQSTLTTQWAGSRATQKELSKPKATKTSKQKLSYQNMRFPEWSDRDARTLAETIQNGGRWRFGILGRLGLQARGVRKKQLQYAQRERVCGRHVVARRQRCASICHRLCELVTSKPKLLQCTRWRT